VVICLERGADCLHPQPPPHHLLPHLKSALVLPFWYRLTQVVQEKRPLKGCTGSGSGTVAAASDCSTLRPGGRGPLIVARPPNLAVLLTLCLIDSHKISTF